MNIDEQLEKIRFQIETLSQAVSWEDHPVESLILSLDWDRDDLNKAHDIFEAWEKRISQGEQISSPAFEADFREKLGIGYQSVKSVVNAFWRNDQWVDVCEAFVDSMGPHPSVEYLPIANRDRS